MLGALLAALSAATFGLNNAAVRRGVITGSVAQALAITVPIGVPLFAISALLAGQLGALATFRGRFFGFLALAGVLHFVWGRYCNYRATKALGGNLAASAQQVSLVVALALAVVWLGETLTLLRVAGILLVVAGPVIAGGRRRRPAEGPARQDERPARQDERPARQSASGFEPKLLEGYAFALLSATGYGVSPVLIRAAVAGSGASLAGGLIAYAAAAAVVCLLLLVPGRLAEVRSVDRANALWFAFSGFWVFLAQMFRFIALSIAPVIVVTPIQRTSSVFRVIFNTLLNREHEVVDRRVIVGVAVSLLGAVALGLSIGLSSALPLPQVLQHWRWP